MDQKIWESFLKFIFKTRKSCCIRTLGFINKHIVRQLLTKYTNVACWISRTLSEPRLLVLREESSLFRQSAPLCECRYTHIATSMRGLTLLILSRNDSACCKSLWASQTPVLYLPYEDHDFIYLFITSIRTYSQCIMLISLGVATSPWQTLILFFSSLLHLPPNSFYWSPSRLKKICLPNSCCLSFILLLFITLDFRVREPRDI